MTDPVDKDLSEDPKPAKNPLVNVVDSPINDPIDQVIERIITDQYRGQGGSYTFDPATGTRTLNPD